jgi:hypothetical protein
VDLVGAADGGPLHDTVRPVKIGIRHRQGPLVLVAAAIRRGVEPEDTIDINKDDKVLMTPGYSPSIASV